MSLGVQGEEVAANYLKNKGYLVVERNFRCRMGEIDIIASINKTLVFVEVKTRRSLSYGLPCESITKNKQVHIKRVAKFYTVKNNIINVNQRIDVLEVLYRGEKAYIRHIENAF